MSLFQKKLPAISIYSEYLASKNNGRSCYKLKTCTVNSTKFYIHSAIIPLSHKVHGT